MPVSFISCVWLKGVLMKIDDGEWQIGIDCSKLNCSVVNLSIGFGSAHITNSNERKQSSQAVT